MSSRFGFLLAGMVACFIVAGSIAAEESSDLTRTLDEYNSAARAGDVKKMLSLRTAEQRKNINKEMKNKRDREDFVMMGRAQIPESYQVQHVARTGNGQGATLYLLAQFAAMSEVKRPRMCMEESVSFKMEDGKWKIDMVRPLGDPDKIQRPKDLTFDTMDADTNVSANIGGRIVKTEFLEGYTLVMLRVMDEEHAVFLAAKDVLERAGVSADEFAPWKLHEFDGHPHKTDKLKFFATGGRLIEE